MAGPFDAFPLAPTGTPGTAPPAGPPAAPPGPFDAYPLAPNQPGQPREAQGAIEAVQAGFQASATGLAWRGRLPDLVLNPENSTWWERALSGATQVGAELLPLMIPGAAAGTAAGTAAGGAVAGPPGAAVGGIVGAGAGMFAIPAAIRETLVQAYKSGEITTSADFWNIVREVAKTTGKEALIGAATMGAGAAVRGGVAAAMGAGAEAGTAIGLGTATMATRGAQRVIQGADTAAQIGAMVAMPAALQGRLPDAQEFIDAAIIVGGMHVANSTAARILDVYAKTGKTPAEQVADAKADPAVAKELATGHDAPEPPYTPPRREDMLTIQENLFTETARLNALEARADQGPTGPEPLSAAERQEITALRARVSELESQVRSPATATPLTPRWTPEQLTEATNRGQERLSEINARAEASNLTDAERAERVFLSNSGGKPEALARHFGLEPIKAGVMTAEAIDASGRRVYDDVLEQVRAADRAREESGQAPLGDDHALAIAALIRARVRTRAARLGVLPEEIYRERPLTIQTDGTVKETPPPAAELVPPPPLIPDATKIRELRDAAAQAEQEMKDYRRENLLGPNAFGVVEDRPAKQARLLELETAYKRALQEVAHAEWLQTTPGREWHAKIYGGEAPLTEVDLFGNPIAAETATPVPHAVESKATLELPLAKLILSKEVPQFKMQANSQGVIVPLGGQFDRTGVGPIQVWERLNGDLEVISGRHRLDLARRSGEETIPAQIHREADGFDARQAATLDAQLNIREEQGSVADYAQYFKDAGISKEAAEQRGLLARAKGRAGFAIARDASPDLLAAHRAGKLSDEAAVAIASAAPGSARLQALGIAAVNDGRSILFAVNTMRAVDLMAAERMAAGQQGDIFGFDDSAMQQAAMMAKRASAKQRQLGEQIAAVSGASKRPEIARKLGVDVQDPAGIQKKIIELKQEQELWDNWPLHPELVTQLRDPLKQDAFPLNPETPREADARDREAAAGALRNENPFNPNVLYQAIRDTWYRSALGQAVSAANIKSSIAKGWQDFLKGQVAKGGVKADEIKWSGIEEWLTLQDGKVTKEQVADYLAQHGVQVEEVLTGAANKHNDMPEWGALNDEHPEGTKFSQYQLPGGENYRELLLTLPMDKRADNKVNVEQVATHDGEPVFRVTVNGASADVHHNPGYPWRADLPGGQSIGGMPDQATAIASAKEWLELHHGTPQPKARFVNPSHYDTPNILAHIRFNERTDADGKRVLFVEEFQSDWAQQGKKKGFNQGMNWEVTYPNGDVVYVRTQEEATARARGNPQMAIREIPESTKVPNAPFVGKTDAWVALAVKRVIRYAAEHGFERVAWTTGEQQVQRYSSALRKAVDSIEWEKTPEGIHIVGYKGGPPKGWASTDDGAGGVVRVNPYREAMLDAINRNDLLGFDEPGEARQAILAHQDWHSRWGDGMSPDDAFAISQWRGAQLLAKAPKEKVVDTRQRENELSDAIGKSMAERIINDPNQKGTIEGEAINISDTGMAGFYDRIVPSVVKDVLKKLDKTVKVGEIDFPGRFQVKEIDGVWVAEDAGGSGEQFNTRHEAEQWAAENNAHEQGPDNIAKQAGFEITPELRKDAMAGQPLFQTDGEHRGSYDVAQNLITIMGKADKSTVLHEMGHSWLEEMKADAAREGAPEQIKADWDILRRELAIGENGEISRASHEQFARSIERYLAEGQAPSLELRGVFERFKQWLMDIYRDLRNLNVEIHPEVRQVMDRMLATDEEIKAARELDVPRAYVAPAMATAAEKIVPPPEARRKIEPGFAAEQHSMQPYADEIPPGPGEAPDNIHVNYAYINGPADLKLAMQRMAEIDQANIQKQRGGTEGVKSWAAANAEQAQYLNDILGGSPDTLHLFMPRDPNAPQVDARLGILKKLAVGAAKDSARLRDVVLDAGHDATVRQQLEYMGSIERARMIQAEFLGERASVARALNALKDTTEGTGEIGRMLEAIGVGDTTLFQAARTAAEEQAYLKAKLDEILLNYRGRTVLDIARLHKEIGTLKGTFKFSEEVSKATKWDMIVEGWRSGLLSGPVTHTTNLFGTESFHFLRPAVDVLAAIIGTARGASPGMGESDRATMSMAVARLTGMVGAIKEGMVVGYHQFRLDDPTTKTESYRTAIPGRAGEIIRIPLRLMGATDAMVQTMYKRGELNVQAMLHAFNEGLNPATREFAARVDQLKDNPLPEMLVAADSAATRMTFNAPPGEKTLALMGFVNKWHLQWVVPFINTPINIFQESLRLSPFAPAVAEWRQAIAKGGIERDRALAEMALGTGIMALTVSYAFGGQITGSSGPDPGKNKGKVGVEQPSSFRMGDTWYEYNRLQPVGTLINFAADMAAVWDHMNDEEKDKIPKMLANAFAQAVTNQTFLQGITNVVNAMADPTRFGPRFIQQLAASTVPNVIGQPTTMADPVVRQVNSALEAVQARVPGLRQDLLPKRDWLGEPEQTRERVAGVLPVRTLEITDDKLRLEAARLNISMASTPKKTHLGKGTGKIGDVELTPEEQDKFAQVGGEMTHKILGNIVRAPGYDQILDIVKRQIFTKILSASHRVAAVAALPPEKRISYLQSITEKLTTELQPGDAP